MLARIVLLVSVASVGAADTDVIPGCRKRSRGAYVCDCTMGNDYATTCTAWGGTWSDACNGIGYAYIAGGAKCNVLPSAELVAARLLPGPPSLPPAPPAGPPPPPPPQKCKTQGDGSDGGNLLAKPTNPEDPV